MSLVRGCKQTKQGITEFNLPLTALWLTQVNPAALGLVQYLFITATSLKAQPKWACWQSALMIWVLRVLSYDADRHQSNGHNLRTDDFKGRFSVRIESLSNKKQGRTVLLHTVETTETWKQQPCRQSCCGTLISVDVKHQGKYWMLNLDKD